MKIEKVNDYQIRCTLTREDLASRKLKISELAYGSKKAKMLFKDMMEMANFEYGFEADNIPLMIEAIPVNSECIVLIITKVEDPEELDTRFSKFAPGIQEIDEDDDFIEDEEDEEDRTDDFSSRLSELYKRFKDAVSDEEKASSDAKGSLEPRYEGMAFSFGDFTTLSCVCDEIDWYFEGTSTLYRNNDKGEFLLVLKRGKMDVADFVVVCNYASEYGNPAKGASISGAFLNEHFETIITEDAVHTIAELEYM